MRLLSLFLVNLSYSVACAVVSKGETVELKRIVGGRAAKRELALAVVDPSPHFAMSAARTPTTLLARWDKGNAQSAVPIIARTITSNLGGAGAGRRAVQIRPFRLPGKQAKDGTAAAGAEQGGRNMYVLRSLSSSEQMMVFVEDASAPSRAAKLQEAKGKGRQKEGENTDEIEGHSRWTFCTLGVATLAAPLATPFDAFLQRVLLGGNQQAINANNPGQWIPRSTAISLEGFIFHIGGDWEVKLGSVMVKGGSAGGSSKGVLIEVSSFNIRL